MKRARPFLLLGVVALAACSSGRATMAPRLPGTGIPHPRVHFPTARDRVVPAETGHVSENAAWLKENPRAVIVLEGHCDERGGEEYNLKLGDRRAREVKAMLLEEGVPDGQLAAVVSFGEREPLAPGHHEKAWRQNRRVEFVLR